MILMAFAFVTSPALHRTECGTSVVYFVFRKAFPLKPIPFVEDECGDSCQGE